MAISRLSGVPATFVRELDGGVDDPAPPVAV